MLLDRVAGALRGEQRLTSELAHELRTPLSGVRGEAELALMSSTEQPTRERLDRIVTLVDQMSTTITTLLAIARGQENPTATRTSVDDIISTTVASTPAGGRAIAVHHGDQVSGDLKVNATTDNAVRALSPLVENAVQHASSRVTLSVLGTARSVEITVSDDGPGLPEDGQDPELLFAPGARSADSTGAGWAWRWRDGWLGPWGAR